MKMFAIVLRTEYGEMLVRDTSTGNEVLVHYQCTNRFFVGDLIMILFSGAMTFSIPPQITALYIQRIHGVTPPLGPPHAIPTEIRAIVLERRRDSLLVREINSNRQMIISYPRVNQFWVGQRIIIRHDSVILSNPIQVNATSITPMR